MSSVDEVPSPRARESVAVGFTIRQHGVRPVNVDGEVGIAVTDASGRAMFFPADQVGSRGHYVSQVGFPDGGEVRWEIRQGIFGPQDLGVIEVAGSRGGDEVGTATGYRWPGVARVGLPVIALVLAAVAVIDAASRRRRPEFAP